MSKRLVKKILSALTALVLLASSAAGLSSCSFIGLSLEDFDLDYLFDLDDYGEFFDDYDYDYEQDPGYDDINDETDAEKPVPDSSESFGGCYVYYRDKLDSKSGKVYDDILSALRSGSDYVKISGFDEDDVDYLLSISEMVRYDYPELFIYDDNSFRYGYDRGQMYIQLVKYEYWEDVFSIDGYIDRFNKTVDSIVSEAEASCTDDYQKALFVHDYLITHAVYDFEALNEIENYPTSYNPKHNLIFTSYGCLVNGRCVCAGFSKAFKLLMDRMGIQSVYVVGWGDPNDPSSRHAWNRIVIGGESYYLDVTWDDGYTQIYKNGRQLYPEAVSYKYFNITTDELNTTHKIDESIVSQEPCYSDTYNYYVYGGFALDGYDKNELVRIIRKQKDGNTVNLKYNDPSDALKAEKDFKNGLWKELGWGKNVTYDFDGDTGYVIIIRTK